MARFGGATFDDGLYRVHSASSGARAHRFVSDAFTEVPAGRYYCFGFDWLGRQFVLDRNRSEGNEPLVLMLEPGTGDWLEIPATFASFHEVELLEAADAALASDFFIEWRALHPETLPIDHGDCIGYRVPLFLGGPDTVENLDSVNMEVYWTITGQLLAQVRDLPPGTPITGITLAPE